LATAETVNYPVLNYKKAWLNQKAVHSCGICAGQSDTDMGISPNTDRWKYFL